MQPLRIGMVGGGEGAFIGAVHRIVATMDGEAGLVCGAFSSDAQRSQRSGAQLGLPASRCYASWQQMLDGEAQLPAEQRMQILGIVTPNATHVPIASAALRAGFHVMCEKPLAVSLQQARELRAVLAGTGLQFGLAHVYTGYPLVRAARELIQAGRLGRIRKVLVEYLQGWMSEPLPPSWRSDPAQAGPTGCMGDIGCHAANLLEYVTALPIERVSAQLATVVAGRQLDDDATVLLQLRGGASGVLVASQVAAGEENNLVLRIYGERGGLEWRQQEPNSLLLKWQHEPLQVLRTGTAGAGNVAAAATRLPAGHPEGYLEAFGNLYRGFFQAVRGRGGELHFPGIDAGLRSMAFLEAVLASAQQGSQWQSVPTDAGVNA